MLRIGFPPSAAFNKRKAEAQGNRERFADAIKTIVGVRLRPVYVLLDEEALTTQPEGGIELTDEELIELRSNRHATPRRSSSEESA